jgi:SIT4-associating protein SAP185/190
VESPLLLNLHQKGILIFFLQSSQPIPILAPPPAPLNIAPSRARRQLAARLALHKQQAAEAAANAENTSSELERGSKETGAKAEDHWQSNPFVISGLEDEPDSNDFQSPDLSHNSGASSAFAYFACSS